MRLRYFYGDELWHYGMKGQKWGVRRFQNPDGSLTAEGKIRYSNPNKKVVVGKSNDLWKRFKDGQGKSGSSSKPSGNPANVAYNNSFVGGYFEERGVADLTEDELAALMEALGLDPNVKVGINELNKIYKLYRDKENAKIKDLIAKNNKIIKETHPSKVDVIKDAKHQNEILNTYRRSRNKNLNDKHNRLSYNSEYNQFKSKEWRDFIK